VNASSTRSAPAAPSRAAVPHAHRSGTDRPHWKRDAPARRSGAQVRSRRLRDEGVEAIAITFLFSFFNSDHERRAAEILAEELPGVFITQSAEIAPEVRLYERTSTTVLNAYVGPVLSSYLARLEERLAQHHYDGPVLIMQSNGGVIALHAASEFAVNTLLSGPAGGPVASASIVEPIGLPKTMTIDMGGTSFEVSLAHNGRTETRSNGELAGQPIATPMLDISTIGAGAGASLGSHRVGCCVSDRRAPAPFRDRRRTSGEEPSPQSPMPTYFSGI